PNLGNLRVRRRWARGRGLARGKPARRRGKDPVSHGKPAMATIDPLYLQKRTSAVSARQFGKRQRVKRAITGSISFRYEVFSIPEPACNVEYRRLRAPLRPSPANSSSQRKCRIGGQMELRSPQRRDSPRLAALRRTGLPRIALGQRDSLGLKYFAK